MKPEKHEITPEHEMYPKGLLDLEEPPKLYVLGDLSVFNTEMISIVGARKATPYGLAVSEMAARIAAESGITVVSGGARGCDKVALRAAIDAGGKTIIVSGVGADMIYPPESSDVFIETAEKGGAVVALVPWGAHVQRFQFPQRNRIIAALSKATFVAEAGIKSGTMSTADAAMEIDRDLYAVPGPIYSPFSSGTNKLIAQGARIICDEQDLEVSISQDYGSLRLVAEGLEGERGDVLSALFACPLRPQELAERLNEDVLAVIKTLSSYEMMGLVTRLLDGRYSPTKKAYLSHNR